MSATKILTKRCDEISRKTVTEKLMKQKALNFHLRAFVKMYYYKLLYFCCSFDQHCCFIIENFYKPALYFEIGNSVFIFYNFKITAT